MLMERNWIQVFLNKNTKEHVLHPSTSINSSVNIQKDIFFIPISRSCPTEQALQSLIQPKNLIKKWQQESISRLEDLTTDKWRVPWNKIDGNELLGRVNGEPHRFLPVEVRPSTTGKRLTSRRTSRPDARREEDDEPRGSRNPNPSPKDCDCIPEGGRGEEDGGEATWSSRKD